MFRLAVVVSLLVSAVCAVAASAPASNALAVTLAQQSVAALTGGAPVTDVTLNASVISIFGSDAESGTGMLLAKGTSESRVDLSLSGGTRSDVRSTTNNIPGGAWEKNGGTSTAYAQHNCWTDAAWFFPALSSLTQTANPSVVFKYIGQEQHGGVNTQHIQVFQVGPQASIPLQRLITADFYLDPSSNLPVAVVTTTHADNDMNTNISVEVDFANYQTVSGIQVPFHVQQLLSGNVVLDFTVTSAVLNSGLSDSQFTLQ